MPKITRRKALSLSTATILGSALATTAHLAPEQNKANETVEQKKIIVVGAHPDDPETGCGGTMALFTRAGHSVVSAYLTRGEAGISGKSHSEAAAIRTEEAKTACALLKVRPAFLGQIDGNCEVTKARYQDVIEFLKNEQPALVFTHWPIDTHRDHQVCSILVYDAWLRLRRKFSLFYFEVMSGQQTQNFWPTDYVNIGAVVEQKHQACFAHQSQSIEKWYDQDHGKMERFRGLEFGCEYAEAFIRHVQSPEFSLP